MESHNGPHGLARPDPEPAARPRSIALAGCGSAGHVFPALAAADAYREAFRSEVIFFGTADGFEEQLVPRSGYRLFEVPISRFLGHTAMEKARRFRGLAAAVAQARRTLRERHVDLVVGFGEYGSVPTLVAARSLGIRTAIHESNTSAGRANKLLGRLVDRIYLGFEAARGDFPAARTVVIGNPVRSDVAALYTAPRSAPQPGGTVGILVIGGSQGSPFLNRHTPELLAGLAKRGLSLEIRHQAGSVLENEKVRQSYQAFGISAAVTPFIDDMASTYRWADFAISSAGAATLAELAIAALPTLLVPLASATNNHQVGNARAFASTAGACWVSEEQWQTERLIEALCALLHDREAWHKASARLRSIARPQAARALAADYAPLKS